MTQSHEQARHLASIETATDARIANWLLREAETHSARYLAEYLQIHNVHIYRMINDGVVSPTLRKAVIQLGIFASPPKRRRFACDVPATLVSEEEVEIYRLAMRAYSSILTKQLEEIT